MGDRYGVLLSLEEAWASIFIYGFLDIFFNIRYA